MCSLSRTRSGCRSIRPLHFPLIAATFGILSLPAVLARAQTVSGTGTVTGTGAAGADSSTSTAGDGSDIFVYATGSDASATAYGGNGGNASSGYTGGNGGFASAQANATATSSAGASASAEAYGGSGGTSFWGYRSSTFYLAGQSGNGNGASASAYASSDYGGPVSVTAIGTAGSGGNATADGDVDGFSIGGAGGSAFPTMSLSNAVGGYSSGGSLTLKQWAYGGTAGTPGFAVVEPGPIVIDSGGSGTSGSASSTLYFTAGSETMVSADVRAYGGYAALGYGSNTTHPGMAGTADGRVYASGSTNVSVLAIALGGEGGPSENFNNESGTPSQGGIAISTAVASADAGNASATAQTNLDLVQSGGDGGSNGTGGASAPGAQASSTAISSSNSGNADATAAAYGGHGGFTGGATGYYAPDGAADAYANATTGSGSANASAYAKSRSSATAIATATGTTISYSATIDVGPLHLVASGTGAATPHAFTPSGIISGTATASVSSDGSMQGSIATIGGGSYSQTAGSSTIDSLTINSGGTFNHSGGTLTTGTLTNNGSYVQGTAAVASLGVVSGTGSLTINGTATADAVAQSSVAIDNGGKLSINPNWGVAVLSSLSIGAGTLDIQNNDLILNYSDTSPASTIKGLLASGYDSGAWDGPGINSSATGDYVGSSLGWADNASLGLSTFDGQSVGNAILVKFTLGGDANLDGSVDDLDFGILINNWGTSSGANWAEGDFNYDGAVNSDDFGILVNNYGGSISGLTSSILSDADLSAAQKAAFLALVPEPGTALLSAGSLFILTSRRRRNR